MAKGRADEQTQPLAGDLESRKQNALRIIEQANRMQEAAGNSAKELAETRLAMQKAWEEFESFQRVSRDERSTALATIESLSEDVRSLSRAKKQHEDEANAANNARLEALHALNAVEDRRRAAEHEAAKTFDELSGVLAQIEKAEARVAQLANREENLVRSVKNLEEKKSSAELSFSKTLLEKKDELTLLDGLVSGARESLKEAEQKKVLAEEDAVAARDKLFRVQEQIEQERKAFQEECDKAGKEIKEERDNIFTRRKLLGAMEEAFNERQRSFTYTCKQIVNLLSDLAISDESVKAKLTGLLALLR